MIVNTTTVEAGFVRLGEVIVSDCEVMWTLDRFELGPEPGEVSFFATWGERFIFAKDAPLQVLHHAGQAVA
jgi:hypothetical protein